MDHSVLLKGLLYVEDSLAEENTQHEKEPTQY